MKRILHLIVFLALIAVPTGGALAFVNNMAVPAIAANELAAEKEILKRTYLDMSDGAFVKMRDNASKTIEKIFKVREKDYIFKMKIAGYKDGTSCLVTPNKDGSVYDYVAISNGDTQELGSKIAKKPFRESLKGRDATGEEIPDDTITGATVSGKPVVEGIRKAARYRAENLK